MTMLADVLHFDPLTHRSTRSDGSEVPHVTAVLAAVGVATDFEDLAALSPRLEARIEERCLLGSVVHADCHAYDDDDLEWGSLDPRSSPFVEAWATCRRNLGLLPVQRERRIFHPVHNYTGILDGIFATPGTNNKRVLLDLKLGDPNNAAAEFQTAAYEAAWALERPYEPINERWAVQLVPDRTVPYIVTNYSARHDAWQDFQKFLAFLTTYNNQAGRRKRIS